MTKRMRFGYGTLPQARGSMQAIFIMRSPSCVHWNAGPMCLLHYELAFTPSRNRFSSTFKI
jgi:hypothetical protein